jgi:hypothetical protein
MHVTRSIHFAGAQDLLVGRQCLLDDTAHLLLVVGMPFHRLEDEAVSRASGLLRERVDARAQLGGKRIVVVSAMSRLLHRK